MKNLCVFCGAQDKVSSEYKSMAFSLGQNIARRQWGLVYGGGRVGLMGQVADGVLAEKGNVIGVIPQSLVDLEAAHPRAQEMHIVQTMHERKAMMADKTHAFLAIPGGFGTMDEICEIITWKQLGFHNKPIAFLNHNGFFNDFFKFIKSAVDQGFIQQKHWDMLIIENEMNLLMNRIADALL